VLILPDIDQNNLFQEFHLDEPWDSTHNLPLSKKKLEVFQCPVWRERGSTEHHTSYVAVVGPETAWPGTEGRKLAEITDRLDQTILLLEIAATDQPWAAPDHLTLENLMELMAAHSPLAPSSRHEPANFRAVFADGSVHTLPGDIAPETLRALLTVNGGEQVTLPIPAQ